MCLFLKIGCVFVITINTSRVLFSHRNFLRYILIILLNRFDYNVYMLKPEELVQKAKQFIDDGFDKLGRTINNPSILDRYLLAATYKAVRFCESISILCKNGMTDEALPILRSLIEHSMNMRWIANKDSKIRLKQYMNDLGKKGFGAPWTNKNLVERMEEVGFKSRDYFDFCVKLTYSYAHVNASSLKWDEVFDDPRLSKEKWSPDSLYVVVAQMLGHVLKALDTHFTGKFSGYDDIWKQISVDKDIRKKVEQVLKSFEESK